MTWIFNRLNLFLIGASILKTIVAVLCHVVLSCFRGEKAKGRHAKTRQMVTFSCFRMATFRSATRKYDNFHVSPFRLLFVVSLPGGAKGRHAKTRKSHHVTGFRVATFRRTRRRYDTFISGEFSPSICRVLAWRGERSPRENTPRLKCRDFVFHFRIFAWRVARRKHEESHISCFRSFAFRRACAHGRF